MSFTPEFLAVISNFIAAARNDTEAICVVAVKIAVRDGEVSADEIVEAINIDRDRRIVGAALGRLKKLGVIYVDGFKPTVRKSSHGRPIYTYKLADGWKDFWPPEYINPIAETPVRGLNGEMHVEQEHST